MLFTPDVSERQKLEFRKDCQRMLQAVVEKLQERCPLKYSFLRALKAFDPKVMTEDVDNAKFAFQTVTKKLVSTRICTTDLCDAAERQYSRLVRDEKDHLRGFDPKEARLDEFFYNTLNSKVEYIELWKIVKLILVLSHGQASVERSFSVNEDMLLPNMKAQTLCAMKLCYDAVNSLAITIHEFKPTDQLLSYCRYVA